LIDGLLAEAGWTTESVDYIGACAPGHPDLDAVEAQGLVALFGPAALGQKLAVHTGVTGFTEAAHGTLALLGALQAMEDGKLPPMVNLDVPTSALADMPIRRTTVAGDVRRAISYSIAPEGTMTAVAVERA
jgi:3-oxoacyl-[acyl-carrier-protein] synthase II